MDSEGLPPFRPDGYLPEGVHRCQPAEAVFRFGSGNLRRRRLAIRLQRWIDLARQVEAGEHGYEDPSATCVRRLPAAA